MRNSVDYIIKSLETHFGIPARIDGGDPLSSLVNTILSQSTNDRNRDMAYARLRQKYGTWEEVMEANAEDIALAIKPAGLSNQKSVRIKDVLLWIKRTYGELNIDFICDEDPQKVIEQFTQLKGVGIKTITVVLMFTCGVDVFPVDTHVHRICRRIGFVPDNATAEKTYHAMQTLVPSGKSYSLHMNFLKLGRTICKAIKPRCDECPIIDWCEYGSRQNKE